MVAARRDRTIARPLAALQLDVAVLLFGLESLQQAAHAEAHRVLGGQRYEDEAHAHLRQLIPGHRVLLVEPLERRRVVESEPSIGEAFPDLLVEALRGTSLRGGKLAPHEVGDAAVEVAQRALD